MKRKILFHTGDLKFENDILFLPLYMACTTSLPIFHGAIPGSQQKKDKSKKSLIDFKVKKLKDNLYEITFDKPLEPGEYVFSIKMPHKIISITICLLSILQ